MLTYYLQTKYN